MNYYFSRFISCTFDEAIANVTESLKNEGFGIISEIRMHEKLNEKLGIDFKRYTILGACNPTYAFQALKLEDKIGAMLPCNVLVIEQEEGKIEVAAINPEASMQSIVNPDLQDVAAKVTVSLKKAVENI